MTFITKITKKLKLSFAAALASLLLASLAFSQEMAVPVDLQIKIFIKVLAFDRNFKEEAGNEVKFIVLYQSRFRQSLSAAEQVFKAVEDNHYHSIEGLNIVWEKVEINQESDLNRLREIPGIDAIYIAPVRALDLRKIVDVCRAGGINTFTGVAEYVDFGVAVSIGLKGDRPQIMVNLPAAKAESSYYSSQLLKLSKIIN